jgi:hypothetical protein
MAFRSHLSMGLTLPESSGDFVRLPQAEASGRQSSTNSGEAHFITTSENGVSEPKSGWINLRAILNENSSEVKMILLG